MLKLTVEEREGQAYFHRNADPVVHQNEQRYRGFSCYLCQMEYAIEVTVEQEAHLMACVPYSDTERARVKALFEEERDSLRQAFDGADIPLIAVQRRIAGERLAIKRLAMTRV